MSFQGSANSIKTYDFVSLRLRHCPALYKPIAEKMGFTYTSEIDCNNASCKITIKQAENNEPKNERRILPGIGNTNRC